ncbi:MAG: sensor histidine kinase [Acidobacteriota bacterium]|nr:sensor histidine kinase [Acidobacteriota bacterium]
MTPINTAALINLLGFTTGVALYAMLLFTVLRRPARGERFTESGANGGALPRLSANALLLATAALGLVWNVGALASYGVKDFGVAEPHPLLVALSFAALGFLPAVVVHSALQSGHAKTETSGARWITVVAYGLSAAAAAMHFYAALVTRAGLSNGALRILTIGYVVLIIALFLSTRRQPGWKRAVWASALAVFAVSALHLSQHHYGGPESWPIELLGHHASLPLALAILYQDYRFAFADIFLKRALSLFSVVALAFGLYVAAASPLLEIRDAAGQTDPRAIGVLLGLWVVTALLYPALNRAAVWFVDTIVLRRADYREMLAELARRIGVKESTDDVLDIVCRVLEPALTAREVWWEKSPAAEDTDGELPLALDAELSAEDVVTLQPPRAPGGPAAAVRVPTTEPPYFTLVIGELAGGRRLLSDDIEMLEAAALMAARRIDAIRVAHERCEQVSREQEISKLATEAQLRALRAQINPHFLFNALTTIGYLIKAAPDRALDTLLKLTDLLRRVLRSTDEFVTLGEELKLIASYLDIERARFEERLRVRIDVPPELLSVRIPSLLIQPLVENAIKHGIAPLRFGGEVAISARVEAPRAGAGTLDAPDEMLRFAVRDTGAGASEIELARGRRRGFGLSSIEERLRCYCGEAASLDITAAPGAGMCVEIRMPLVMSSVARPSAERIGAATEMRERRGA